MLSLFIFLLLILSLFELINNCHQYKDCFNCSVGSSSSIGDKNDCEWNPNNEACNIGNEKPVFNYNFFSTCYDEKSLKIQKEYCGNTNINFDEKIVEINLVKKDGKYGNKNLYCEYRYEPTSEEKNVFYKIKGMISSSFSYYMKVDLIIGNKDGNIDKIPLENFENEYDSLKSIKIQVYCERALSSNPFMIKIERNEVKKNYKIFISVGIIVLVCIICGVIIYCFSRKAAENARRRQRLFLELANQRRRQTQTDLNGIPISPFREPSSSSESEISITEINTQKIEKMLKTTLAPIKYYTHLGDKDGNPSSVCTICLEDFKDGKSNVSLTPCQHVFHFKCLSNWLMKNVINPKCPNCNHNFLEDMKIDCLKSQGLYDIPEIPIVKRSYEYRNINADTRMNYYQHNNSINMENGLDTGENRFIDRNEINRDEERNRNRNIVNNMSSCIMSIEIQNSVNKSQNNLKKSNVDKKETSNNNDDDIEEIEIENIDNKDTSN